MFRNGEQVPAVAPGEWRVVARPGSVTEVAAKFAGARDPQAVRAQLVAWMSWAAELTGSGAGVISPLREYVAMPKALGDEPSLTFDAPKAVGIAELSAQRTPAEILELLRRTATALDALHVHHVVHGGLGLDSLWWMADGSLRFADIGLAHSLDGLVKPPPQAAGYLAPEMWRSQRTVPASDQYALAVIAFELFSGRQRVVEDADGGLTSIEPLALESGRQLFPGASTQLNEVLQRALSTAPGARYPSCLALVEALEGHVESVKSLPTVHLSFWRGGAASTRRVVALGAVAALSVGAAVFVARGGVVPKQMAASFSLSRLKSTGVALPSAGQKGGLPMIPGEAAGSPGTSPRNRLPGSNKSAGSLANAGANPGELARGRLRTGGSAPTPLERGTMSTGRASGGGATGSPGASRVPTPAVPRVASAPASIRSGVRGLWDRARNGFGLDSRQPAPAIQAEGAGILDDAREAVGVEDASSPSRASAQTPARTAFSTAKSGSPPTTGGGTAPRERIAPSSGKAVPAGPTDKAASSRPGAQPAATVTMRLQMPEGSRVYLNGVLARPIDGQLTVPAGTHDVDIVTADGTTIRRRVKVEGGTTVTVKR